MSGGEPFASNSFLDVVIPALINSPHVLTNLSAPEHDLVRFARLLFGADCVSRAAALRDEVGETASIGHAPDYRIERGVRFLPQLMKTKTGVAADSPADMAVLRAWVGERTAPHLADTAPSYRGRRYASGVHYFVLAWPGDAWSCRSAQRRRRGSLGNLTDGTIHLLNESVPCPYDIGPCAVADNASEPRGRSREFGQAGWIGSDCDTCGDGLRATARCPHESLRRRSASQGYVQT